MGVTSESPRGCDPFFLPRKDRRRRFGCGDGKQLRVFASAGLGPARKGAIMAKRGGGLAQRRRGAEGCGNVCQLGLYESSNARISPQGRGLEHCPSPPQWPGRKRHRVLCGRHSGGDGEDSRRGAEAQRIFGRGDLSCFLRLPWTAENEIPQILSQKSMDQGMGPSTPMARSKTPPRPLREALRNRMVESGELLLASFRTRSS